MNHFQLDHRIPGMPSCWACGAAGAWGESMEFPSLSSGAMFTKNPIDVWVQEKSQILGIENERGETSPEFFELGLQRRFPKTSNGTQISQPCLISKGYEWYPRFQEYDSHISRWVYPSKPPLIVVKSCKPLWNSPSYKSPFLDYFPIQSAIYGCLSHLELRALQIGDVHPRSILAGARWLLALSPFWQRWAAGPKRAVYAESKKHQKSSEFNQHSISKEVLSIYTEPDHWVTSKVTKKNQIHLTSYNSVYHILYFVIVCRCLIAPTAPETWPDPEEMESSTSSDFWKPWMGRMKRGPWSSQENCSAWNDWLVVWLPFFFPRNIGNC